MRITLDLEQADPPEGRAHLRADPRRPPRGTGASGVSASVRFPGWLGLIKGISHLIRAWGNRATAAVLVAGSVLAPSTAASAADGWIQAGYNVGPVDGVVEAGAGTDALTVETMARFQHLVGVWARAGVDPASGEATLEHCWALIHVEQCDQTEVSTWRRRP